MGGGRCQYLTARKKTRCIRTHSFGASWPLHQFTSYSEIHTGKRCIFVLIMWCWNIVSKAHSFELRFAFQPWSMYSLQSKNCSNLLHQIIFFSLFLSPLSFVYTNALLMCCAIRVRRISDAGLINFSWTWGEQRTPGASSSLCVRPKTRQILVRGKWYANRLQTTQHRFALQSTHTHIWFANHLVRSCIQGLKYSMHTVVFREKNLPVCMLNLLCPQLNDSPPPYLMLLNRL